jgi:hypothetical protein
MTAWTVPIREQEKGMNTNLLKSAVMVAGILFAATAQAQSCSNANLQGSFGYSGTGNLRPAYVKPPLAGPFAEVGSQSFDGDGNTTATATLSADGTIQAVTVQGKYHLKPDCTGSMVLNVSPLSATVHLDIVLDQGGAEVRAIVTDSGVVESRLYQHF